MGELRAEVEAAAALEEQRFYTEELPRLRAELAEGREREAARQLRLGSDLSARNQLADWRAHRPRGRGPALAKWKVTLAHLESATAEEAQRARAR